MNRVALYARVSSEIQEKEATIESQAAQLREAAHKQGDVIIQEYRDDGFSGDLLARPGLDRLRDDAARKQFDRVLILSPDRLARKWIYGEVIADELRKHGVAIQYLNQKDDGTEEGKLLLGITGLFAQYEKAKMIERIRRGRLFNAKSGRVMLSKSPFGYDYIPKTPKAPGHLQINASQAEVVRLIFDLYGNKEWPATDVARELHRRGISSPSGNSVWGRSMIMKMLHSSTYAGTWHYNKTISAVPFKIRKPHAIRRRVNTTEHRRPRDQWVAVHGIPAIVDQQTFAAVQRQLERNKRFSKRNRRHQYLLVGLTRCAGCGRAVCGSPNNGYTYYRCTGNFGFAGMPAACPKGGINSGKVDTAAWKALREALENPRLMAQSITEVRQALSSDDEATKRGREEASQQLEQIKRSEARLLDAYTAGAITVEQIREEMQKLRDRRESLTQALEEKEQAPRAPSVAFATLEQLCRNVSQGLDVLENDFDQRQRFVRSVVDKVVMERDSLTLIGALPVASAPQEQHRSLDVGPLLSHIPHTGPCHSRRSRTPRGREGGVL